MEQLYGGADIDSLNIKDAQALLEKLNGGDDSAIIAQITQNTTKAANKTAPAVAAPSPKKTNTTVNAQTTTHKE